MTIWDIRIPVDEKDKFEISSLPPVRLCLLVQLDSYNPHSYSYMKALVNISARHHILGFMHELSHSNSVHAYNLFM